MNPDQLFAIRQSLNKAYRLVKPRRAAVEAFKNHLLALLQQAAGQESAGNMKIYLEDILRDTYYDPPHRNNSPVCYADVPGLREGFEEPSLPEVPARPDLALASPPGTPLTARCGVHADLKAALQATQYSVNLILADKQAYPPADTALEKKIKQLVYQLYELSPEEIGWLEKG
jgi:hypothetical protein